MESPYVVTVRISVQHCGSPQEAVRRVLYNAVLANDWTIESVDTPEGTTFDRSDDDAEMALDRMVSQAEEGL
jgi:hypothetical protein